MLYLNSTGDGSAEQVSIFGGRILGSVQFIGTFVFQACMFFLVLFCFVCFCFFNPLFPQLNKESYLYGVSVTQYTSNRQKVALTKFYQFFKQHANFIVYF